MLSGILFERLECFPLKYLGLGLLVLLQNTNLSTLAIDIPYTDTKALLRTLFTPQI